MSLGLALFVIFILYLIHANKAWKGAAKVAGVLLLLGAIGVTAIVMYSEHEDALETAKQKAEAQAQQEADARAAKDRWAELESMELCAKGDLALTGNQYPFAGEVVIFGNTVALISYSDRIVGSIIEHKDFARTMRSLYELAWKAAEPRKSLN